MKERSSKERKGLPHIRPLEPKAVTRKEDLPLNLENWVVELKFDGIRAVCYIEKNGYVKLETKGGMDATTNFPELHLGLISIATNHSVILDGEIVMGNGKRGMGRFATSRLMKKPRQRYYANSPLAFFTVFDILHLDGTNLMSRPLLARKEILAQTLQGEDRITTVDYWDEKDIENVLDSAQKERYEGIVLKRKNSIYYQGPSRTGPAWLKLRF